MANALDGDVKHVDAVEGLRNLGRDYVAVLRVAALAPMSAVALVVVGDAPRPTVAITALSCVVVWSAVYVVLVRNNPSWWVTVLDAVALAALALTAPWSVPPGWIGEGMSWLMPVVAFACVGYQYYAGVLLGGVAAAIVVAGSVTGTILAMPPGGNLDSLVSAVWLSVLAVLGRILWTLVEDGGTKADHIAAAAEQAQVDQVAADEVRAAAQAHNRRLHGTAAATLLMVGTGLATRTPGLLQAQARRDLEALHSWEEALPVSTDLTEALKTGCGLVDVDVRLNAPDHVVLPPHVVRTIADATAEALSNVVQHADVETCRVEVAVAQAGVVVTILDEGVGFDPSEDSMAGWGLRDSIRNRMSAVGGVATVRSAPGAGTTIVLRWPEQP